MQHDIVIREGKIVDGTGADPFIGDIAIDGDTIAAVGKVAGKGREEIDAEGEAVTPGFVDLHTHFDAQAAWDPMLTPASWHGVTTALMGNCGVTFAPCKPKDRNFLAEMMESVEDIPRDAILEGLSWKWESYGEYLDAIDALAPAINVTGLVGHCASRLYVMGERAVDEQPTEAEIEQIAQLVGDSVKQGALGFSTNRLPGHTLPDGRSIPGTFASEAELVAISKAVGEAGGMLQNVLNYSKLDDEIHMMSQQLQAAKTRMLFSAPVVPDDSGSGDAYQQAIGSMRSDGMDINGVTVPRSGGFISGLKTSIFFQTPAWQRLRELDFDARLAAIRDQSMRDELIREASENPQTAEWTKQFFWLGDEARPNYTRPQTESLFAIAEAAGEHPAAIWLKYMLESDGQTLFHVRFFNHNLDQVVDLLKSDWVVPGLGDAGAHATQIMDAGWASFFLAHWHREKGVFSLAEAVRKLTSAPARILGFEDRGTLKQGQKADLNIIEMSRVAERQPQLVHDFPRDAPRLIQKAVGYKATVCNGQVILRNDELTGARGGQVLRNPAA